MAAPVAAAPESIGTPIGILEKEIAERKAKEEAPEPGVAVHHAYNHMNIYDDGFHAMTPETAHFSYDHSNHYDVTEHPMTPV